MTCDTCGDKPKKTCSNDFTKTVIEINNPETLVLLRKVVIPASMGGESQVPASVGKYRNVVLQYEANGHIYLYSSDGIPTAITSEVPQEVLDRIAALEDDTSELQQEFDDFKNSPDVVDIVATYADLQAYDTAKLGDRDIIRVLADENHDGASTYYQWDKPNSEWDYIGEVGPYYTKDQTDTLLAAKQNSLTAGSNISITQSDDDLVISATDTTYTAGTGLSLNNAEFSVDTTVIAEKSDIPTKTSELVNDGADGSHAFIDTSTFEANSNKQSIRGGYNSGNLSKFGTVSLGDAASATETDAVAIGARAHAYGVGSIAIGSSNSGQGEMPVAYQSYGVAIGHTSRAGVGTVGEQSQYSVALGANSAAGGSSDARYSVAIGAYSKATKKGQVDISTLNAGASNTHGYNNSEYRLLTGLYDPQSAHDAATKGYVDPSTDSSAPTTATTGRLGEIRIDTSTDTAYICVKVDSGASTYTWKQITT